MLSRVVAQTGIQTRAVATESGRQSAFRHVRQGRIAFLIVALLASATLYHYQSLYAQSLPTDQSSRIGESINAVAAPDAAISFKRSQLLGGTMDRPTSLQFGPDGRLYVAQQDGLIRAYTIARTVIDSSTVEYRATMTETITLIQSIPNHNDDGSLAPAVNTRQVTGLLTSGTAQNPILFVSSSDPRIAVNDTNPPSLSVDTNSGIVSRLTWNGSSWNKLDLVRGLPRSKENHSVNGMALDKDTNTLYLMVGGSTNMGAPSTNFSRLPEYALSSALLSIDLDAIGNSTYNLPTLDDEDRAGTTDANDPFGGNIGKNQAIIDPAGPVQVYSPGWRNSYDVVRHTSGRIYAVDNGSNADWGNMPSDCKNLLQDGGINDSDVLQFITGPGYYGGHPNPTRGSQSNTFNTTNPQSPVPAADPTECTYISSGNEGGALTTFNASTNGITEYLASNFSGALQGQLLTTSYSGEIWRIPLNAAGNDLSSPKEVLLGGFGVFALDVTTQSDNDIFPGTIWATTLFNGLWAFEPDDFDGSPNNCQGTDNAALDEDGDGFDNADEIDNGTNPCSAGSLPFDNDGDLTSDLNDPDDDNDGINDSTDIFALDAKNGMSTSLPVILNWNNGDPDPGGLLSLGFTGLMENGTDYMTLFDADKLVTGGAAGIVTLSDTPAGDAYAGKNTQQYGFQFGVNVAGASIPFTIHTRLKTPFKNKSVQETTAMGIYFGTGDQDNYLKLAATTNGGAGGIQVVLEQGGTVNTDTIFGADAGVDILNADDLDLMLHVNPMNRLATISYAVNQGTRRSLGDAFTLPAAWFSGTTAPAVGIIATSAATTAFPVSWDFLTVTATPETGPTALFLPLVARVTGAAQSSTVGEHNTIESAGLNIAPVAFAGVDFVVADADGDGVQAVKLSSSGSYDPDGGSITYTWSSNTGIDIPVEAYPVVELPTGVHTITLTVRNEANETATDAVVVTVLEAGSDPVLYRVNAGGGIVPSTDSSQVSWEADTFDSPSLHLFPGGNIRTYFTNTFPIDTTDPSLNNTAVNEAMFHFERYAITSDPPSIQMQWDFPIASGTEVEVRIYLAEIWFDEPDQRVFSISFEGQTPAAFTDIKMFEEFGANYAVMRKQTVTVLDDNLDIDFIGIVENPAVKAIEIVKVGTIAPLTEKLYLPIVAK
ncbi:MAG: malectin domain-containing carbohydrate-binding protein [Caldilineaceae bacterium]